FNGPIGAVRIGLFGDELVVNPNMDAMFESDLDLVLAGTKDAIMMVEGKGFEVPEAKIVEALEFGHNWIKKICAAIDELRTKAGVEKTPFEPPVFDGDIESKVTELVTARFPELAAT